MSSPESTKGADDRGGQVGLKNVTRSAAGTPDHAASLILSHVFIIARLTSVAPPPPPSTSLSLPVMLARLSKHAARAPSVARCVCAQGARRGIVQPSGAERASVVDLPATYKDETHFTPQSGE